MLVERRSCSSNKGLLPLSAPLHLGGCGESVAELSGRPVCADREQEVRRDALVLCPPQTELPPMVKTVVYGITRGLDPSLLFFFFLFVFLAVLGIKLRA